MSRVPKNGRDYIQCHYCGKVKTEVIFVIGACRSDRPDWCMVEGTGHMACPDCYPRASLAGQEAIDQHVAAVNRRVKQSEPDHAE